MSCLMFRCFAFTAKNTCRTCYTCHDQLTRVLPREDSVPRRTTMDQPQIMGRGSNPRKTE